MIFSSLTFLVFFLPITLIVYYIVPKPVKNYCLLVVSLLFYFFGVQDFLIVMVASILVNYVIALLIDRTENVGIRRALLVLTVVFNLAILFYNKYMNFTTAIIHHFNESVEITGIVLPIGISFFTFQAMSYVIDVYRHDVPAQKNPFDLGLYISFFPQLVAGPIVRYRTIAEQLKSRKTTLEQFGQGVTRFMIGFTEKMLLSNAFATVADQAFLTVDEGYATMSVAYAWMGGIAYSFQILFDFAGYSNMAIGLGKMFGFEFMENFNHPYIAKNVTDFWRRWHISLSQWFRDYVYFPLGGSRVDKQWKVYRNLFVVWLLTGIWHGANFTFIAWGLGYFIILCFEKMTKLPEKLKNPILLVLYRVFTLMYVVVEWVIFRAGSLGQAYHYIRAMFGTYGNPFVGQMAIRYFYDYRILFIIAVICCTPLFTKIKEWAGEKFRYGWIVEVIYDVVLVGLMIVSISCLIMGANNPFIYFNF